MSFPSTLIEALGWTLLHFLWQGTAVAAVLWVFLRAGKGLDPRVRYTAAALALTGMMVWPAATCVRLARTVLVTPVPAAPPVLTAVPQEQAPQPEGPAVPRGSAVPRASAVPGAVATSAALPAAAETPAPPSSVSLRGWLRAAFPGMVGAWALGVSFLSVRFFLGWRSVGRLRRSGTPPEDVAWTARFESLKTRLEILRPVTMLVSATSAVPMVIGWIKPVVLVPAGLFLGLRVAQLEALLAHELAHVRRHDYLANLLQAVAETVLFYHPAVWWVSAQMRKEREHCCDDIGSSITGSPLEYVRALTALEEIRGGAAVPAGAVSAAGGSLLGRVRRLLGAVPREHGTAVPWVFGAVAVLVAALAFSGMKEARGGPAAAPDTAAKKTADARTYHGMDQSLLARWQALEGGADFIPEGRVVVLRAAIGRFLDHHAEWGFALEADKAGRLRSLIEWHPGRAEHSADELAAYLRAVLSAHGEPIQMAFNESPAPGRQRPAAELAALAFGPAATNGLRAAIRISPVLDPFVFGDETRVELHLWNTGSETLVLGTGRAGPGLRPELKLHATGQGGREAAVSAEPTEPEQSVRFTATWQLRPGETTAVYGWPLVIGPGEPRQPRWRAKYDTPLTLAGLRSGEEITLRATIPYPKTPGDRSTYEPLQAGPVTLTAKAPEDMKVWSTRGYGTWPMAGGVTLEVRGETVHAADVLTTAVLAWPDGRRSVMHVAADAFGNREPWALAWETGRSEFWIATGGIHAQGPRGARGRATDVVKVDFSSPAGGLAAVRVKSTHHTGWPKTGGPSPECRAAMEKLIDVTAKGEVSNESTAWPTSNPATMQANWLWVTVSILPDGRCQIGQHEGGPWPVEALEPPLRARAAAARAVWKKNMGNDTPGEPHAVVFAPASTSDEVKQKVIDACRAAGLVPADAGVAVREGQRRDIQGSAPTEEARKPAPDQPDKPGLAPITDGTFMAQVLNVPGHDQVVILTKRGFTASDDSTSRSGSITLPVNTSDKTLTITYSWPEATPGVIDLKSGGYPVSRFDLSRGRVFFVHFEKNEFSADVFQVPATVKVPAISSPATLTQAAEGVAAWYATADDRALWECTRVIVPEKEVNPGQPLDAAAEKIAWGEPNDVGLRLGLRGLEPGAAVPVGQPLPIKQFIRNDGPTILTLSPTHVFNEGVDGELIRISDGTTFPHRKGYRWQSFFHRVRLAPGHYIELQSGPMRTFMAEKDGSSAGAMAMMDHGFTVLPGEYTLRLSHGIGQFLGRPVNFHFGDPRGAPGLGEWTGVLKSASVPLRLADQQIKTAKPGSSEAFGRYKIDFDKGALKLRHYNGYPNMALAGEPWEPNGRDWRIEAVDGDYLVAWAVGGQGIWVKEAEGITHLVVKDQLTETGHWTLDQAAGAIGPMPAGVRAAFNLPLASGPQAFDFRKLPKTAGPARIDGAFFEMSLPAHAAVLKVAHGRKEFFVEYEGHAYGPAEGNPVVELGLTDILRKKLAETPNTSGLATLETMIRQGSGPIRDCAFRLLGELKTPQTPVDYGALFGAMIGASIEDDDGPKELSPEARTAYTHFWNLFHASRREWERTRPLLASDRYQPGEKLAESAGIVWTPGPDGISLGVSSLPEGVSLEIGRSVPVAVYLRNDGPGAVKLSVPAEHNPFLQISVTDDKSVTHSATYPFSSPLTGYQHRLLEPGTGLKVASVKLESYATAGEAGSARHQEGEAHNLRLAVPPGQYRLHLEYRNFQEAPVAKGSSTEWTGKLTARPVTVKVKGPPDANPAAPAPTIRGVILEGLPQRDDVTTIAELYEPKPGKPRESRQKTGVFFMSLGAVGPWVYHRAGAEHFYLEVRPDPKVVKDVVYGPIDGHPAEKLDLAGWLKESPTHPDPGYARRVARNMLATGDGPLASLALGWLGEFKAPSPPDEHGSLITAIERHLTGNPQSSAADHARTVLARLRAMAATASAEWEKERKALPDESYGTGEPLEKLLVPVQWADPATNGLRLGLAGLRKGEKWSLGSEHALEIYLRNDGNEPVKFSWTARADEGLGLLLTDAEGTTLRASIVGRSGWLVHNHCRLDPGHFLKLKPNVAFKVLNTNADGASPEPGTGRNAFLLEKTGLYRFEASCHIGLTDWADSQGNKRLRPAGEWEGVLKSQPVDVVVE